MERRTSLSRAQYAHGTAAAVVWLPSIPEVSREKRDKTLGSTCLLRRFTFVKVTHTHPVVFQMDEREKEKEKKKKSYKQLRSSRVALGFGSCFSRVVRCLFVRLNYRSLRHTEYVGAVALIKNRGLLIIFRVLNVIFVLF